MSQNYKCISGDTHLEIPNERWTHRIDKKYRDRAPRTIRSDHDAPGDIVLHMKAASRVISVPRARIR